MISPRGWFGLELAHQWTAIGSGKWVGEGGGALEILDLMETRDLTSEQMVESHEAWCEKHALNSQQTRLEETPGGVTVLRSFGETRSDDFLLVAHLWDGGHLTRLSLRSPLERLSDIDLADVLGALFHAHSLEQP
ncbi:MAG: hypothetical protein IPN71_16635 [Fibrobacteres bacterium]|jgi:hypothetical protein|nr:hypothetical protein [Fibrobacterota bacterium]